MIKLTKALALIITGFLFVTQTACTNDNKDAQKVGQNETFASKSVDANTNTSIDPADLPGVYNIISVGNKSEGKFTDFTFEINGKQSSFADYTKGKVVFLNFWGTWCPPCRAEIPDIIKVADTLKNKDFVVIGIAMERSKDAIDNVKSFVKNKNINYKVFMGNADLASAYGGIQFVPTTFLIDQNGNIVKTIQGSQSYETFISEISKILK
jgi:thiol-disulfide isomerase/thioredoxin